MRLHPMTRATINQIVNKYKPRINEDLPIEDLRQSVVSAAGEVKAATPEEVAELEQLYYYGIMMMSHSVVTIFKNNEDIAVTPCDINAIHNWCHTNLGDRTKESKSDFWQEMCLPGMTEGHKLPVYFNYFNDPNQPSDLKIVYVCEEQSEATAAKLSEISRQIFYDLYAEKLVSFMEHSELIMFNDVELPDTKCVIIANHSIDQYTHYNIPNSFGAFNATQMKWLHIFEQLHHLYLGAKKKKEFCIKRMYGTDTYLLYSRGKTLIFCVIDHT